MDQSWSLFVYFCTFFNNTNGKKGKLLQNFDHPSNYFISSSKNLKWYRNFTKAQKFLNLENVCFLKILAKYHKKFEILQQRRNENFFLPRLGNFPVLVENFFSVPYRRSIDLEILQVSKKDNIVCLGFEPTAAGWKAQTNPLNYGGTQTINFCPFNYHATVLDPKIQQISPESS